MKQVLIESTWHELVEQFQQCDRVYRVWYRVDGCVLIHDRLDTPHETREVATPDDEGHVPTPFEPCKGVTLWDCCEAKRQNGGIVQIRVGGKFAGYIQHNGSVTQEASNHPSYNQPVVIGHYLQFAPALRAFRDRIRAKRAGFTPAQVAEIERIARSVGVHHA